jgi:FkbM family methyltransferase
MPLPDNFNVIFKKVGYDISEEKGVFHIVGNDLHLQGNSENIFWTAQGVLLNQEYRIHDKTDDYIMIDVGLNLGIAALYAAKQLNINKIYGFEPFKPTFQSALTNLEHNTELATKIEVFNFGLSDRNEEVRLSYNPLLPGSMSTIRDLFVDQIGTWKETVLLQQAAEALGPIIAHHREAVFLKIDCEGAEFKIIADLDRAGLLKKIDLIILEWHAPNPDSLVTILNDNGFICSSRRDTENLGMLKAFRKKKQTDPPRGVVYTCITGGYDQVINHYFVDSHWDYMCFTDNPPSNKDNFIWEFRPLLFNKLDNIRNQRWHKLHPHILFPEYQRSLYVDGNLDILNPDVFKDVQNSINQNHSIAISPHFSRTNIYEEYEACALAGKDSEETRSAQFALIKKSGFDGNYLDGRFFDTSILFREHHAKIVIAVMNDWWWWIEHYSYRDQLSLTYVLNYHRIDVPVLTGKSYREGNSIRYFLGINHLTLSEAKQQIDRLGISIEESRAIIRSQNIQMNDLQRVNSEKDQIIDFQNAEIRELKQWLTHQNGQLECFNNLVRGLQEQIAVLQNKTKVCQRALSLIENTLSWKITAPLRRIRSIQSKRKAKL